MNSIIFALILGGSVSSGFSGKPAPEIFAERLGVPYENEARICHRVSAEEVPAERAGLLIVNIDGNYWRSYDRDCDAAARAVRAFYAASEGARKIMATVPERNAGGFYRFFCGAQTSAQACRPAINAALREGCAEGCTLIDADEIYARHADEPDIHLTPAIWREEAEKLKITR